MASGDGLGFVVDMADDWRVVNRRRPKHSSTLHVRSSDEKNDKKQSAIGRALCGEGAKLRGRSGVDMVRVHYGLWASTSSTV